MKTYKEIKKSFSLTELTKGKVKRLTLHFQDIPSFTKDKDGIKHDMGNEAIMSGTLYIFKDKVQKLNEGEDNFYTVNFTFPLQANAEFKRHILSIIDSAIKLDKTRVSK
jgi:hypothetical protein